MSSYPNRTETTIAAPKRLGRYELIGQLATGGMAEIHLARLAGEGGFEKIVVVKRLLPELVASPAYVSMFLDEGKLVARLDHPNICEVHELGRDGAEYYLAMPYLDGIAVHELIARPRDPDRMAQLRVAAGVVVQACAGLHHAHELKDADGAPAGLVHRDVSPSNLFVTSAGIVKVLDFGIAKVRGATETEVGTIKGKQQYMAPEQLLGEPLDRRCDVFALGIVLFELATHARLFKRGSDYLTAKAVLEEPIPRADAVDPAVPPALADVIEKALARARDARFPTAAALAEAVEAALPIAKASEIAAAITSTDELSAMRTRQARVLGDARSKLVTSVVADDTKVDAAPTVAYRAAPPLTAATTIKTSADATPVPPRRRPWFAAALALVVLAALALVVVIATRRDGTARAGDGSAAALGGGDGSAATGGNAGDGVAAKGRNVGNGVAHVGDGVAGGGTAALGGDGTPVVPAGDGAEIEMPVDDTRPDNTRPDRSGPNPRPDKSTTNPRDKPRPDNPSETAAKPPGLFSIDSTPWATIYVDGQSLGITPIVKRSLPPGKHKLRAVLKDGRVRELTIDIPAGKLAKPIQLTW